MDTPATLGAAAPSAESASTTSSSSPVAKEAERHAKAAALIADDSGDDTTDAVPETPEAPATPATPADAKTDADGDPEDADANSTDPNRVFRALTKKNKRLREKTRRHQAEVEKFQQERQAFARERSELEQLRAVMAKAKDDPVAFIEEVGVDYRELTSRMLKAGSEQERIERLEARIREREEQDKRAAEEAEQTQKQSAAKARLAQVEATFLETAKKHRHLSAFDDGVLVRAGHRAADALAERLGRSPSFDEIAQALEQEAKAQFQRQQSILGASSSEQATEIGKPEVRNAPKTLSNRAASESSGRNRHLTEAERRAAAAKLLGQSMGDLAPRSGGRAEALPP
jgi:hypothetical protein